ncbi:MAG: benzoate-CoA ligase family protein [Rhodospirillales bacterium]|nr:benzoate-CoA ligase family protein [Rhodospirillales bacterium]
MRDHTVAVDTTQTPTALTFAENFNVAVPFIDRHVAEGRGAKVAIRDAAGHVTYAALAAAVNRAGNALTALGLGRGDRVLMVVKDCPAFFYLFWGAIKAGFVPVPLNTLLRGADYRFVIENSRAACIVWSPEFAGEVEPGLAQASHRPTHALHTEGEGDSFAVRLAAASDALTPAPAAAADPAFWLYTSGSTGTPKGGVHRHRDMVVTSQFFGIDTLGITPDDIHFSAAKLFFAYGLGNAMTFPLWTGGAAVLLGDRPTPETTFATIEAFRPTVYYGVPTLYAAQLQALESTSPDLSSVRLCVSAGEPLPAAILERWRAKTGLDIVDGIGTTEILHIFISNRPGAVVPGTSGTPVPGYEARLVDDDGRDVAPGETGNLLIRGQSLIAEYWGEPERTAAAFDGEWLRTGDTYLIDANGCYVCCGRSDDMLKVGGIWVSPVEIEARLIAHPAVLEAAVVGRPDDDGLIKPEAWIVLAEGQTASEDLSEALATHCKAGLARYKYPRWVRYVDALPKTATGKIQRYKLRDGS